MAKNLSELPARTTVADTDLLHINTGGANNDYKMTRANFLNSVTTDIANLLKRGGQRIISDPDAALQWGYVYGINGSSKMPSTGYWALFPVQYSESSNANQIAMLVNTLYPQIWVRSQTSAQTWGSWYQVYPENQTAPTVSLGSGLTGTPVVARYGKIVVVSMTLSTTAAKNFTDQDVLFTISPAPAAFTRAIVSTGGSYNCLRINTGGQATLNNAWSAASGAYILGQIVYVTA
jgi:hypothetical protein